MNAKTLTILSGIALLGGIWFVFLRGDAVEEAPIDPLSLIDFDSGVQSMTCTNNEAGTTWTITTKEGEVLLTSPGVAGGAPVRANQTLLRRILSFLKHERPLSSRSLDTVDLSEWGLEPPTLRLLIEDTDSTTELHIGRPDIHDEVGYRTSEGDTVFKLMEHLVASLRLPPAHYRDPRLLDAGLAAVTTITYRPKSETPFSVVRMGARWMLTSDGQERRGDQQLSDSWTNAMSGLVGEPIDSLPELTLNTSIEGILEFSVRGRTEPVIIEILGQTKKGRVVARRKNDRDLRLLEPHFSRYFEHRPRDLADRLLVGFSENELSRIEIKRTDGSPGIHLENPKGQSWFVLDSSSKRHRVDAHVSQEFFKSLLNMTTTEYRATSSMFETAVTARFKFNEIDGAMPITISFGKADANGNRWARRSDEDGEMLATTDGVSVLQTQWWQLLDRGVALGDDSRIDWLRITNQKGLVHEVLRTDGVFRIDGNSVNREFLKGILSRCAYLVASGFTGPPSQATKKAMKRPTWKVEWRHEGPDMPQQPLAVAGPEVYTWTIGRRVDETHYECMISSLPDVVFLVPGRELSILNNATSGIKRARSTQRDKK